VWFIAFAPYENPKYAVAVMVQGAKSGGGVAAPIAAKILEDTFKLPGLSPDETEPAAAEPAKPDDPPKAEPVLLASLAPAIGNFRFIESVDFGRAIPAASSISEDSETASTTEAASSQRAARPADPNIREDADDRGRVKNKDRKPSGIQKFFNFFGGNKDRKEKEKKKPSVPSHR